MCIRDSTVGVLLDETRHATRVVAMNKSDLGDPDPSLVDAIADSGVSPVSVSALTGEGVDEVRKAVVRAIGGNADLAPSGVLVTNARHHELLTRASKGMTAASAALSAGYSEEIALVGLHESLQSLGELTGETVIEDILGRIFATFCVGK